MLDQAAHVRLLYTAALTGQIDLLPRLLTLIKQERAAAAGPMLLVDLGVSCTPGSWLCVSTGGRGMLVAMDAMGYDAFHIGPRDMLYTQPALVNQIREIITTPLAAGPWVGKVYRQGLSFLLVNAVNLTRLDADQVSNTDLVVALRLNQVQIEAQVDTSRHPPTRSVLIDSGIPEDSGDRLGQPVIGRVDVVLTPEAPYIVVEGETRLALTADHMPDPTMFGVIEFVQGEARYAERKRGGK